MRKKTAIPAAALAALFALGLSAPAEARKAHRAKGTQLSHHDASLPSKARAKRAASKQAGAKRRSPAVASAYQRVRFVSSEPAAVGRKRKKTFIRQNGSGGVVMERGNSATASASVSPVRDLPGFRAPYDYPPTPCEPSDVVLEAHVHDVDSGASESQAELREESEPAAEPASIGAGASLSRIARQLGSFFRPKSSDSEMRPQDVDLAGLVSKSFLIPVEGVDAARLQDSFLASRRHHTKHLAIDIGAPRGTPIVATTDGEILRVVRERRGGKSIYQKDSTGQYLLFYCHLSKYAEGLSTGKKVRKGEVIGYVGSTGHVIGGPHLHFSITRVPEDANFKKGLAINPYLLFLAGVP
jgi:murein DD-endopeptidase MepM/ murein hydrolase activator NlpD